MTTLIININNQDKSLLLALLKKFKATVREVKDEKDIKANKIPNAETIKAIEDVEKGIGLIKVKNSADLFKQLGI